MNILQIVPSLVAGGAERATIDVAAALVREGHKAFVISSGGPMVDELEKAGATHIAAPVNSKNPFVLRQNSALFEDVIARNAIDVVHVRSRAPAWSAYLACRHKAVPLVTTFHAAYKGSNTPWKKFYNSVMTRGAHVIAISDFIAHHIKSAYGLAQEKITVIPRGIDFSVFDPAQVDDARKQKLRDEFGLKAGVPLMIMPGRLSPIKGQEQLLWALQTLADVPFQCLIIGPDQGRSEYRERLQHLIGQLKLQEKVRLVPRTDLMAAYALADLVISTSQVAEGFGRVPVEAEAFGVPVIATALGATAETVLDGETGWLVPLADEKALTHAILRGLTLSPEDRRVMGLRAQHYVRSRFDVKDMCAKTLRVYAAVMQKGGAA